VAGPRSAAPSARGRALSPHDVAALRSLLADREGARTAGSRAPARRSPRAARATRAARRRELLRTSRRWTVRGLRLAACALALPLVVSLLLPGPAVRPATGSPDATTLALTARTALLKDADTYRQLAAEVDTRRTALDQAVAAEQAAEAALAERRQAVGQLVAAFYGAGPQPWYPVDTAADALQGVLHGTEQPLAALQQAQRQVTDARSALAAASRRADAALADIRATAVGLRPEVSATMAGLGTAASGAQQAREDKALARWQAYLAQLAAAGIDPPPAAALADPGHLPEGLAPALDADRRPAPGIAWVAVGNSPMTVLPAETVAAVSAALSQLGKPYAAGATGPDGFDCGGFTATSWLLAGYALPSTPQEQWATAAPVSAADLQVGDLVFASGGRDVGVYLGDGDVLGASAVGSRVGVRSLEVGSSAVRVTLPAPARPNAALTGGTTGACGAPPTVTSPAWGGYANGRVPASQLCRLGVAGHMLRCDAAAAYRQLSDAFAAAFGSPLCITDSYRSYAAQVAAFREKPALAAVPGTSNHGWGVAVDLCGGINVEDSPQSAWMRANAGRFGFVHPPWAQPGGEKPEPWHWEFGNYG
jgi:cell wall-associated NlpC family hydrolase